MFRRSVRDFVFNTPYSVLRASHSAFAILAALILGCAPALSTSTTTKTSPVTLKRADSAALNDLVASHKGQVVLIDYWATWCGPCVANFPHTVELAKKHKNDGLVTIAVSFDLFEDEPKVRDFLAKQGAEFDNLISSHNAIGQKPAEDFDIGPLPEYRLYDRQGKLRQKWESGVEQAELDKKVAELLAEIP
jgi:thiol-disulfide isomerase/thioredoxin